MAMPYRHLGIVLVRASTDPGHLDPPTGLDLSEPDALREGRIWLAKVWARPEVQEALRLTSPVLGAAVDRILAEDAGDRPAEQCRRVIVSVATYLLRWQRRTTPFGLFAGVCAGTVGPATAELGSAHRVVLRVDADWLLGLIGRLERHPELRSRLTVVADSARFVRDDRVFVYQRNSAGASTPGPLREASVRHSPPVRDALAAARTPIRFDELAARLTGRFPSISPQRILALLHGLVDGGFLITSLRPPMTVVDGLPAVVRALRAAGAEQLPEIAALLGDLDEISAALAEQNGGTTRERATQIRAEVSARLAALAPGDGPLLAADVRLDARIVVPDRVLTEAARAADALLRTTAQPAGSAPWREYHARFLDRYGPGALVPVPALVADSGLGFPAGYLGGPAAAARQAPSTRDTVLLRLIQRATVTGAEEIELTDADISALAVADHAGIVPPDRVELGVELYATSTAAIDRGEFLLRVSGAPVAPTSMAGRFAHLLDEPDRARLAASYALGPSGSGAPSDAVPVQLSFPPRRPHFENVVRVPPMLPDIVSLSEHPDPTRPDLRLIDVVDLAVTADEQRLYLVRRSTGQRLVPRIPHALDRMIHTPPLARFLAEVAGAGGPDFRSFDLGLAEELPYVPRIRYGRTVLVPARWILTADDLSEGANDLSVRGNEPSGAAPTGVDSGAWRKRWGVPTRVVLVSEGELRLPLDLDQPLDRALLRAEVERTGRIRLEEDGPAGGRGWSGRPVELVIPLSAAAPGGPPLPGYAPPGVASPPAVSSPPGGSDLLHAQLLGNPARFDDILATHLPRAVAQLGDLVEHWWVWRDRDPIRPEIEARLCVVLRLRAVAHYAQAASTLAALAAELTARALPGQLLLAPYRPHTPRYGDGPAWAAAERVFAADTTAAISQVVAARRSGVPAQALAAASMVHLAVSFAADPEAGYQLLLGCPTTGRRPMDRTRRAQALRFADATDGYAAVRALPGGDAVAAAWSARDAALDAYHRTGVEERSGRDLEILLRALLHQHHLRAVGADPAVEAETLRLARSAALGRRALGHNDQQNQPLDQR